MGYRGGAEGGLRYTSRESSPELLGDVVYQSVKEVAHPPSGGLSAVPGINHG